MLKSLALKGWTRNRIKEWKESEFLIVTLGSMVKSSYDTDIIKNIEMDFIKNKYVE